MAKKASETATVPQIRDFAQAIIIQLSWYIKWTSVCFASK